MFGEIVYYIFLLFIVFIILIVVATAATTVVVMWPTNRLQYQLMQKKIKTQFTKVNSLLERIGMDGAPDPPLKGEILREWAPTFCRELCKKTAEPIDFPFELWTRVCPAKHKLNRIRQAVQRCPPRLCCELCESD